MFKKKQTSSKLSEYSALSKYLRVTEYRTLYCDACDTTVSIYYIDISTLNL